MVKHLFKINLADLKTLKHKNRLLLLKDFINKPLIYGFRIDNKYYIGATTRIEIRLIKYINKNKERLPIIELINKTPDSEIEFYIFKLSGDLCKDEIEYIKLFNSCDDGHNRTYGGKKPKYGQKIINNLRNNNSKNKIIYVYDKNTNVVIEIKSVREASRILNIPYSTIQSGIRKNYLLVDRYLISYTNDMESFKKGLHRQYNWFMSVDGKIFEAESANGLLIASGLNLSESIIYHILNNKIKHKHKHIKVWRTINTNNLQTV